MWRSIWVCILCAGVTPRRWLAWCNPELSALITETLGTSEWWVWGRGVWVRVRV